MSGLGPFAERWRAAERRLRPSRRRAGAWRALTEAERPQVAVEVRPSGLGVLRTRREKGRALLAAAASVELPPDALRPSLTQANLADPERFRSALRAALEKAGVLDGAAAALVLPDPVVRVAVVPAADLPARRTRDVDELLRFRLRKSLPFEVREARLGHLRSERGQDPVLVVAALEGVVAAYEEVCRSLGLEPGQVEPASLALWRSAVAPGSGGDRLLVNWDEGYATLVYLRDGWPLLVRTLTGPMAASPAEVAREAAQTLTYARERMGGTGLAEVLLRSAEVPFEEAAGVLEGPLGVAPVAVDPWPSLGSGDPGPAAQALAGAAATLGGAARPVNLAARPFQNQRLPNLLVTAAVAGALALTAWHAVVVRDLLPEKTSALHAEVARLEEEEKALRAEQASLRGLSPEPAALARWTLVKDLVDRRAFSWTGLFARLEEQLPDGARVVSIAPSVRDGAILLEVQAVMRSPEVGWEFMRALEEGGDFQDVFPLTEGANGEFRYTMRYRPRPEDPAPAAPPSPAAGGGGATDQAAGEAAPVRRAEGRR